MYLPKGRVKLNKRKHKIQPWMTTAILKSINSTDKLYKLLGFSQLSRGSTKL